MISFAELCTTYPTWDLLQTYLTSAEGGNLRCIDRGDKAIIRYVKGMSDFTKPHVGTFRSVVWNKRTNRPVSVAPVKANEGVPELTEDMRVSEFLEGVMVQGWNEDEPCISTRTSLGGTGHFYSQRSFADLFHEAGGFDLLSSIPKGSCASFLLQHPEHKLVSKVPYPRVYVICIADIDDTTVTFKYNPAEWPQRFVTYAPVTYEKMEDTLSTFHSYKNEYTWQGMVFQNSIGRWRIRNPQYELVHHLRGTDQDEQRFLRLRANKLLQAYLVYFKEENELMWNFEKIFRENTGKLHKAYCDVHKSKSLTIKDLPYSLRPHVYALHGQYLESKISIVKSTVVEYVNGLALADQKLFTSPCLVRFHENSST
jgi:hypothetical protein